MALIELTGKHAIGDHQFAIIDDDMLAYISQWRWKAKPNGSSSGIYAVRNTMQNGKNITVRMHRVVLGIGNDDQRDGDHINHQTLDNRRINLRAVTRSANIKNMRLVACSTVCKHCGSVIARDVSMTAARRKLSCGCRKYYAPHSSVFFTRCTWCDKPFVGKNESRMYCSESCRCKSKHHRGVGVKGTPQHL